MNDVRLHIERLVLDGVPVGPGGAALVGEAVEAELTRLVAAEGLGPALLSGGAHPVLRGASLRTGASTGPRELGVDIARAVHSGLGGRTKP